MRICTHKTTGQLLGAQTHATKGTLIKNAIAAGYAEANIEEREITEAEWADPAAPWNQKIPEQREAAALAQRNALFGKYDEAVWVLEQQRNRGSITQAEFDARVAPWYAFARELELVNDTPEWWRDTVWPIVPGA